MNLYKWLNPDGTAANGGRGAWPLPNGEPGEWMEVRGTLIPCVNGLHLCRSDDLVHWIEPTLFRAEYDGEILECRDKVVVRRARLLSRVDKWNDRTARLFACRCVRETSLGDGRTVWDLLVAKQSRIAVEVAERFATGQAANEELQAAWTAANDDAWTATGNAAWAARAAAWTTANDATGAARDAAWTTAWAAANDAARVARATTWATQSKILYEMLA